MNVMSEKTVTQFVTEISRQQHAMAGAVIAASMAQAVALGLACMRISRDEQNLQTEAVLSQIDRSEAIQKELLNWCDRDAKTIAQFVALREAGQELAGQQLLCRAPAAMGGLAVETAVILQNFRPLVCEQVKDDLEMSICLLAGAAQAALLLLDSNLRIWPEPELVTEFEPVLTELDAKITALSPVERIRTV